METDQKMFSTGDYAVFVSMLTVSVFIGLYYAWKDRNAKDVETYLVGGGTMSPIPVAISLCVSYVSGIMMVGVPTQVYYFGMVMFMWIPMFLIGPFVTSIYYIPLFFRLKIASVYQILEMRFGNVSRLCASTSIVLLMVVYMGLVTFVPCLSLNAVSNVSMTTTIIITCVICTFYTTLGGLKGVIWTDVVQAGVMIVGMLLVIIRTSVYLGGFDKVTSALQRGQRLNFFDFDPNPYVRNSSWTLLFGSCITWIMMASINQPMVQRYLSCRSVKDAQLAVGLFVVPQMMFLGLAILCGAVMYAYFETCDPTFSGKIAIRDQALPYMVVHLFQDVPGVAGLFVSAVYSGTLSTISSGINALASVALNDYILPFKPHLRSQGLRISKFLVVLFGFLVLLVTFGVSVMGSLVVEVFLSAFGSIGGPLLGVYTMALFLPWCNQKGAVAGQIVGTIITLWMSFGQAIYKVQMKYLKIKPIKVSGCVADLAPVLLGNITMEPTTMETTMDNYYSGFNATTTPFFSPIDVTNTTTQAAQIAVAPPPRPAIADNFYAISNNYFGTIGFLICILVGVVVSWLTGFEDPKDANTMIFTPFIDNKIFPEKVRKFFRFGVPERELINNEEKKEPLSSSPDEKEDTKWLEEETKMKNGNTFSENGNNFPINGFKYSEIVDLSETVI